VVTDGVRTENPDVAEVPAAMSASTRISNL
jgi:hypothetical protein